MTAIRMHNVGKAFKQQPVIARVNLDIAEGEFVVFVGPSGCGKSTLLRLIAGLEDITSGDLFIGGRRANDLPPAQRGVAMVFQSYALYPHMTVFDNMAFGLKLAKQDNQEMKNRVLWAAETLRIDHLLDRLPRDLSGGQRQRVAIGRAIVRQPQVFLFDEPLSNLDAALRVQTRLEIAKLHRDFNASMIYVTHDQVEAMTLADRIVLLNAGEAILNEGSVAQVGSPLELYHRPCNRFVASFIGSPAMNFLPARLISSDSSTSTVIVSQETMMVAVDATDARPEAAVTLGIRPENLAVGVEQPNTLRGEVLHVEHLGEASYIHFKIANIDTPVIVRHAGDLPVSLGERLPINLPAQHCHLFNEQGWAFPRSQACAGEK